VSHLAVNTVDIAVLIVEKFLACTGCATIVDAIPPLLLINSNALFNVALDILAPQPATVFPVPPFNNVNQPAIVPFSLQLL
jgi:hypothetical protein